MRIDSGFWRFALAGRLSGRDERAGDPADRRLRPPAGCCRWRSACWRRCWRSGRQQSDPAMRRLLILAGAFGLGLDVRAGLRRSAFTAGPGRRWSPCSGRSMPAGRPWAMAALAVAAAFLLLFATGLADRGVMRGDAFVVGSIGLIVGARSRCSSSSRSSRVLIERRSQDNDGVFAPALFDRQAHGRRHLALGCLTGRAHCGVCWNSLLLAVAGRRRYDRCSASPSRWSRTRTGFRAKGLLRLLDDPADHHAALRHRPRHHPAVRPPRRRRPRCMSDLFGIPPIALDLRLRRPAARADCWPSRRSPILVLIGVVEGISPSMEEAAQTLRADRWRTFRTVTWPLMRPGLANAFLHRLRREPGRFRQSAGARRQFRRAVDRHLLRHRRRRRTIPAAPRCCRSCCCSSRCRPSCCSGSWLGQQLLHDRHRQGRRRHARARCRGGCAGRSTASAMPWVALHRRALRA